MLPEEKDAACLWDILNAAQLALDFTKGIDINAFQEDDKTYFATIAQLQIIGEATKRLSENFRNAHAEFAWSKMARMRDWLIHHYDRINIKILWDTITEDLPTLIEKLSAILPENNPY